MFAYLFSHPIYSNSAPFHLKRRESVCCLGSFSFFLFPFSGTFSVILGGGPDGEGARKRLFCPAAPVKGGCPPFNVISGTGRVHFGRVKEDNWVWTRLDYRNAEFISQSCPL